MAVIQTIECEECGGKSVVKIPTDFQEEYQICACPLCGAAVEAHDDLNDVE